MFYFFPNKTRQHTKASLGTFSSNTYNGNVKFSGINATKLLI